jgi:sterol desaturase/sphingolipid hydroxylase (fatty acid hydroxylase superfamily)
MTEQELIRLGFFASILIVLAVMEVAIPRRRNPARRAIRWVSNLGMVALNTITVPLLLPIVALGAAQLAAVNGWGLFNYYSLSPVVAMAVTLIALDFIIYLQHVAFHAVPFLWRLHRVHHSDTHLDATSAIRFHLIEILISMLIKVTVVTLLGAPVAAVLVFEIILNATALFNHANIRIPLWLDGFLRTFLVTPDMHRVHHSVIGRETDSNFGFNLSIWDRLCRTYIAQPEMGHEGMTIGVDDFREPREQIIDRLLLQPFKKGTSELKMVKRPLRDRPLTKLAWAMVLLTVIAVPIGYSSANNTAEADKEINNGPVEASVPAVVKEPNAEETNSSSP